MSMKWNASDIKNSGYYTPGMGWSENEPLVTTDENGQRVVQTSGLQREGKLTADGGLSTAGGDRLAKAYDNVKSNLKNVLENWRKSKSTKDTSDDDTAMRKLYLAYKQDGRYDGTYEDFAHWLNVYMAQMQDETLHVSALANSNGTATADGSGNLTQAGKQREADSGSGGGVSSGGYQKRGNAYSNVGFISGSNPKIWLASANGGKGGWSY